MKYIRIMFLLEVKCIFKFYLARVNSIPVEITSAWIFPSSFYKILLQMIPLPVQKEDKMNTGRPKGNQKHLDLSARIVIEQHLNNGDSFRSIAIELNKDPSTISKEVRRHSIIRERSADAFAPIPCANNYDSSKPRTNICNVMHMCGDNECRRKCILCRKFRCSDVCKFYKPRECEKLNKPPYVCNGCSKRTNCMMDKKIYSSKYAQDTYEALRTTSREGINQTPESIQKLDDLLSPLLKKGQSIAHIYASHADEIACSRRTIYSYIDRGVFQARNIDLRRKVVYKQRKRKTAASLKDRSFRKDRGYKEFLEYIAANKSVYIVEMDTVEGAKGTSPCFLTMFFRNCSLMLMFLLEEQTQKEVTRIFDHLTNLLGIELFQKLFEVILTDNGHEFQDRQSLEYSKNDEVRTRIYYCDPNRSDQKGALEKNHEYIRYVLPKGTSFEKMTDKTTLLLLNHINSEKRDSLNGHSPYEVSRLLLDNRLHKALGLAEIPADEVTLIPELIK